MTALADIIRAEIAACGPIPVARYMALALAHPEHGYYMTRDPFGAQGDFMTAPEVSQMFGEMAGLWAAVVWEMMGRPDPFVLAELGPGRGTLMADALRAAARQGGFVEAARLWLVETSPALRARQARALAAHMPSWCACIEDVPPGPAIVIANEFFDALPVRQFVRVGTGAWAERLISADAAGRFHFAPGPPLGAGEAPAGLPADAEPGEIMELCAGADAIARHLGGRLAALGGAALIFDYGHVTSGTGETLQAVRGHEYADPLAAPGAADLTVHVDFAALATAARDSGATTFGPMSQGHFLQALGIVRRAERLAAGKDDETRAGIEGALRRLIAPSEMGNLFKVLALTDGRLGVPPGFAPRSK